MSIAVRLISGSAAAWTRIIITMISQVVLVPIYLTYWSPETYGVWIAIQSLVSMLTLLDLGHHMYVGFELFRFARTDMVTFCKYLWSAILVGLVVAAFEMLVIFALIHFAVVPFLLGESKSMDAALVSESDGVLLLVGINWFATSALTGFIVRALEAFGYHARLSWLGVVHLILANSLPAIAVVLGASFLEAGIVMTAGVIIFYLPIYYDMYRLMKREGIMHIKPSWRIGFRNFVRSLGLTGKLILENLRQQGVRLVLAPISGAVALAAFSTMRTGANVALQGLNSITNPLMPDLMRFLHERDQDRSEAGFSTIWVVLIVLISPAVIVLQALAAPLFQIWTHDRIQFDPLLFSMLSLSVLIFAVAQPAVAVVMGNNLMRPQLILTSVSATIVVALVVVLVPVMGLVGAGIAIVASEIAAAVGYVITARSWLRSNDLLWPGNSFTKATTSVAIAAAAMILISLLPRFTYLIAFVGVIMCMLNFISYWRTLPGGVRFKFRQVVGNIILTAKGMLRIKNNR
jgi:O-antigen/teichoic acid export membrane protein